MIPVTIHLDAATFAKLERIAKRRDTNMRQLIVRHLAAGLGGDEIIRSARGRQRAITSATVDEWEQAARLGVTNGVIAERYGVSKSLVSRELIARGIRRKARHTT
jgi:predicted transcriptional regulator